MQSPPKGKKRVSGRDQQGIFMTFYDTVMASVACYAIVCWESGVTDSTQLQPGLSIGLHPRGGGKNNVV